jgi:hypothetical protein
MRSLLLILALSSPAFAAEKRTASATMQVTATVVHTSETATNVTVVDTVDADGKITMRTFIYPFEGSSEALRKGLDDGND